MSQQYHPFYPNWRFIIISFSPLSTTALGKWSSSGNKGSSELKGFLLLL